MSASKGRRNVSTKCATESRMQPHREVCGWPMQPRSSPCSGALCDLVLMLGFQCVSASGSHQKQFCVLFAVVNKLARKHLVTARPHGEAGHQRPPKVQNVETEPSPSGCFDVSTGSGQHWPAWGRGMGSWGQHPWNVFSMLGSRWGMVRDSLLACRQGVMM